MAINSGRDDADLSLDLESLLIRFGADVNSLDDFQRTPLHYAFTSLENRKEASSTDPIQIVSFLVEAMDHKAIDQRDMYGCSSLHYAAQRGSTVCALLLIQKGKIKTFYWICLIVINSYITTGAKLDCLDCLENTPLAYAVDRGHNSCTLMLIQKEANINVKIHKEKESVGPSCMKRNTWKYSLEHWREIQTKTETKSISLFEKIVDNGWLGITYIVLEKLDKFGFSIARAIEVAFKLEKFQFAKTLLSRTTDVKKLNEKVNCRRNLIGSFAFYCRNNVDKELVEDIYSILKEAGLLADQKDDFG